MSRKQTALLSPKIKVKKVAPPLKPEFELFHHRPDFTFVQEGHTAWGEILPNPYRLQPPR